VTDFGGIIPQQAAPAPPYLSILTPNFAGREPQGVALPARFGAAPRMTLHDRNGVIFSYRIPDRSATRLTRDFEKQPDGQDEDQIASGWNLYLHEARTNTVAHPLARTVRGRTKSSPE
jgi:hypothetical protein